MDDSELRPWLEKARTGDTEAYGTVVVRLSAWLRARLRRTVRHDDDLDDVVQDAFVRAWENLDRFDPARPFGPWIARIGVNLALDRIRRRGVRDEVDDEMLETVPVLDDALDGVDHRELLDHVEAAMDELPEAWALVLRLKAVEEMSTQEIADALGIPPGTVMSRVSRARDRITSILAARYGSPKEDPA